LHDLAGDIVATVNDSEAETKLASTYNSTEFGVPQPGTSPPKYAWLGANGLATELSSGTATKGGASYVPQIARNLQTASVVPPGAFPNGSGTGSENTAVIPGWSTALANAESAATLAEYTVQQEALRKKAEQEALETNERLARERTELQQPTPTEGGAEEGEWNEARQCEYAAETRQEVPVSCIGGVGGGCSGDSACAASVSICGTWPYCSSFDGALQNSGSPVAQEIRSSACSVDFDGIISTCKQVLERAKAEYGADNYSACTRGVSTVSGALGGVLVKGEVVKFIGGLLGIDVGAAASRLIC
jgi:hypothetical protein